MAKLIETVRLLAFEARASEQEADEDWDDDLEGGPEIIYAYGDSDSGEDDEDDVE
jgi:hypothetical protein